ncbi:MAG: hypothetical protein LW855_07345 [Alphaproteobacteria bacterium]|jgi:hypothetical protein|nr:hypothetical protein [Thalassospira sp.]MCE2965591.1 hypothetical protein [Alphaproteobacteria bacterium]
MTALSEQRLRALVMFMAASRESLNGYYGKVFEGDTNKVTINNIDASWGRFLVAVVPAIETPTFDAAERAETISEWYKGEFKLADAPASYRGSSQQEASYRAIVAQGIG